MNAEGELTAREQEVLGLLREGLANKEIADTLGCAVRTVEFHVSNLLRKVGASSRLELVARGRREQSIVAPASDESPLIEVRLFSGLAAAALGDTLVVLWSKPASRERWNWKSAFAQELMSSHASGVRLLSLVSDNSSPPDSTVCALMKADLRRFGERLRTFVVVPLGDSIWTAISGCASLLFGGQSGKHTVAASFEQGFARLLQAPGPTTPSRSELERAIAELSRLLGVVPHVNRRDAYAPKMRTSARP
jgi:DNA-binding CsgD family transcriptional regulator